MEVAGQAERIELDLLERLADFSRYNPEWRQISGILHYALSRAMKGEELVASAMDAVMPQTNRIPNDVQQQQRPFVSRNADPASNKHQIAALNCS